MPIFSGQPCHNSQSLWKSQLLLNFLIREAKRELPAAWFGLKRVRRIFAFRGLHSDDNPPSQPNSEACRFPFEKTTRKGKI
jgi:hypothetical protein